MKPEEVAQSFAKAFNKGDLNAVASFLSEDFKFSGAMPEPVGAEQWLGITRNMKTAFPDIQYNLRIEGANGNKVKTTTQLSGTHTGKLDLSALGMGVIPPTGKSFSNPIDMGYATVENDKITSIHIESDEQSGMPGILAQLGIQPPAG